MKGSIGEFAHLAEKSEKSSIPNLSAKRCTVQASAAWTASARGSAPGRSGRAWPQLLRAGPGAERWKTHEPATSATLRKQKNNGTDFLERFFDNPLADYVFQSTPSNPTGLLSSERQPTRFIVAFLFKSAQS